MKAECVTIRNHMPDRHRTAEVGKQTTRQKGERSEGHMYIVLLGEY